MKKCVSGIKITCQRSPKSSKTDKKIPDTLEKKIGDWNKYLQPTKN